MVRDLCLGGLAGGGEIRLGFPDWGILDRGGTRQDGCGKRRRKDGSIIFLANLANACVFFFLM